MVEITVGQGTGAPGKNKPREISKLISRYTSREIRQGYSFFAVHFVLDLREADEVAVQCIVFGHFDSMLCKAPGMFCEGYRL